tara:strand:+ start:253 stop:450 length:198 start_codon:yes stop_codon:yes gene_type:complete
MIEFKIGDRYMDHTECDSFTVRYVNEDDDLLDVVYDNGTHGYLADSEGVIGFFLSIFCDVTITKL